MLLRGIKKPRRTSIRTRQNYNENILLFIFRVVNFAAIHS